MIKIIKNGVKPKNYKKIYNLTCARCQCEFEFEESDCANVRHEKHIDGEYRGEINCPCCGERLFIDFKTASFRQEEIIDISKIDRIIVDKFDPWDNEYCNNCAAKNRIGSMCNFCSHYPYKVSCSNEVNKNE